MAYIHYITFFAIIKTQTLNIFFPNWIFFKISLATPGISANKQISKLNKPK